MIKWKDRQKEKPKPEQIVIAIYKGKVISGYFVWDFKTFFEPYHYDDEVRYYTRKGVNLYFYVDDLKI